MNHDIYQQITDKIIALLETSGSDWRRPWLGDGLAKNIESKRPYRGINIPMLGTAGFSSQWFGTYRQIAQLGGQVRKGEKAAHIFFWKPLNLKDKDTDEEKHLLMARSYAVFNAEQYNDASKRNPHSTRAARRI